MNITNMKLCGYSVLALLFVTSLLFAFRRAENGNELAALETGYTLTQELRTPKNEMADTGGANQEEALLKLKALDDTHPNFQPRFDGIIANEMLVAQKTDSIDPYARRAMARLDCELPLFTQFSEVCRLSGLCEYSEALQRAYQLQEALKEQSNAMSHTDCFLLEAHALLEIAALEKQLHKKEACQKTLGTLKETIAHAAASPDRAMQEAHAHFIALLEDQDTSLLDYFSKNTS